jgi:hypothetical protein
MKQLLLFFVFAINFSAFSQNDKTVTLTVSAQGQTISEAKQNALRDAIEQAFGAFISSNTEILNDELIKDEIVSVSNGNIQDYEVISEVELPNGGYATTLTATVSVTKLTSFAESKGANIEFKGGLFAVNMMQQELNEKAELKAVKNIIEVSKSIFKKSFDYSIESLGSPIKNGYEYKVPLTIKIKFNENFDLFRKYFNTSMRQLSMSSKEIESYKEIGKSFDLLLSFNDDNKKNPPQTIYFRNSKSIDLIQVFIFSLKDDIINFKIDSGLNLITGQEIFKISNNQMINKYLSDLRLIDLFRVYYLVNPYTNNDKLTPSIITHKFPPVIDGIYKNDKRESFVTNMQYFKKFERKNTLVWGRFTMKDKDLNFEDGNRNIILNFYNFYSDEFGTHYYNGSPYRSVLKTTVPEEFFSEKSIIWINFNDTKTLDEIKQISEYTIKPILD